MTFNPETNRIQTMHLTADELAALKAAKHGVLFWSDCRNKWMEIDFPSWTDDRVYRAKPAPAPTIMVNGAEVPEPVREALERGTTYYVADVCSVKWRGRSTWIGSECDLIYLSRGLIHLTEAAAVAHAKAMAAPGMMGGV